MLEMPRRSDQSGYAVIYEKRGREIASYLVIALDEKDAEAQASVLFYNQHPSFDAHANTLDLTFHIEKRSSKLRWDH